MLEVDDVHVTYGGAVRALQGATVAVPDGKVVALLGSNGAGKSTMLRAISGVLGVHRGAVVHGDIRYDGHSLLKRDPSTTVADGIVQVPEGRRIFTRMTVEENIRAGGLGNRDRASKSGLQEQVYDMFPLLKDRSGQRAGLLSGGEQQMLAIGRALMAQPKLLLLDEPSLGLAPRIIGQIAQVIKDINARGVSVLLVEQNAAMALGVADLAYVLDVGQVSLSGSAQELAATDAVQRLYLGHGPGHDEADVAAATSHLRPARTLGRWTA